MQYCRLQLAGGAFRPVAQSVYYWGLCLLPPTQFLRWPPAASGSYPAVLCVYELEFFICLFCFFKNPW